jgi:putative aminopeptidase FrvX
MAAPDLLRSLLAAAGPSGHEEAPARIWREAAGAFAEVSSDTMGSSFARVRAGDGAPTLVVMGHIDEIGVAITNIEEEGFLSYITLGGINPATLIGQRLEILTKNGPIPGVVGRKRIPPEEMRDPPKPTHNDLHIDIGARDRDDAASLVRVGDPAVWAGPPVDLPNGRLVSRALDNRLGAYMALEVARRIAQDGAEVDVVAVAAVQEEVGLYGARAAAFGLDPQVGIALDVTPTTDTPGGNPRLAGPIKLGMGAMIGRGPTLNKRVTDLLAEIAEAEGIPYAFEIYSSDTHTDADEIFWTRAGVPTALISIPTRYLHTPTEMCELEDIESIVRLVTSFAKRLARDTSFVR